MRLIALLLVVGGTARAGERETAFATHLGLAETVVHDVAGFQLPGGDLTHVLVGRYEYGKSAMTAAVLMKCDDRTCEGRRAEFGTADQIDVLGIVDLQGTPGPLPSRPLRRNPSGYEKIRGDKMKFPVLVLQTTESKDAAGTTRSGRKVSGRETRTRLYVISLVEADRGSVVLMDTSDEHYATGAGTTRTYRLDKGESKTSLDLIAKEQRHLDRDSKCIEPEPIEAVFSLEEHHYRTKSYAPRSGC